MRSHRYVASGTIIRLRNFLRKSTRNPYQVFPLRRCRSIVSKQPSGSTVSSLRKLPVQRRDIFKGSYQGTRNKDVTVMMVIRRGCPLAESGHRINTCLYCLPQRARWWSVRGHRVHCTVWAPGPDASISSFFP